MTTFKAPVWAMALLFTGCALGEDPDVTSNREAPSFEEWVAELPTNRNGQYIVDWDVPVRDVEALRPYYWELFQGDGYLSVHQVEGVSQIWDEQQKLELTYCVSSGFGARHQDAVDAMTAATADWMASANIRFTHDASQDASCNASNTNVLFDVNPVSGQQYIARAFFPGMARADSNILIDEQAWDLGDSGWTLEGVLAHEVGHTLGFRHEHVRAQIFDIPFENWMSCILEPLISQEGRDYDPLTEYDKASVMHYPQCGGTGDLSLTDLDREGIASLYGDPVPAP